MSKKEPQNKSCKTSKLLAFSVCGLMLPFRLAIQSLRRHLSRTVLTIIGVVIGIAAVITVMSSGQGLERYITSQMETFGTDGIQVEIKVPNTSHMSSDNAAGQAMGIQITTLKIEDAEAIKRLPNVKNVYATLIGQQVVSLHDENKQVMIWGTTGSFIDIDKTGVLSGRFYTEEEDRSLANVAVIGQTVRNRFFNGQDPIGKQLKIGKQKFTVVGVMNKRGSIAFFDMDDFIYLPVRTLQKKIMGVEHLQSIFVQVEDVDKVDATVEDIEAVMRQQHEITDPNKDDFAAMSMKEALELYEAVFGAINLLLIAIASISLVVGGVGIMNIMYVSVTERTYEIGLRKALGATYKNILWQFLWEAVVITFFGAIVGFLIGVLLSYLISVVAASQGIGWTFLISPSSVILAGSVSFILGIVFGVFPAMTAAKLDPVTALRK